MKKVFFRFTGSGEENFCLDVETKIPWQKANNTELIVIERFGIVM